MARADFTLDLSPDEARAVTGAALESLGYSIAVLPNGSLKATRGSLKKTLLLGAMAGKNFHTELLVTVGQTDAGATHVGLARDTAGSAVKGGLIGANKANTNFAEAVQVLLGAYGTAVRHHQRS